MKPPVKFGNKKLDKAVMIYSMNAATDCPSDALGMCPLGRLGGDGSCYAWRNAERFRPTVLAYRRRQEEWWNNHFDPSAFVAALRKDTRYFRFSEAGDFRTQNDVNKMDYVCALLRIHGIQCYGHTRRSDLNLATLRQHATVIVSGSFVRGCSVSTVLEHGQVPPAGFTVCPGSGCMNACKKCLKKGGRVAFYKH